MARAIWKGAITFGLVHLPVALYPATQDSGIDFDWLDRRTLDPVGYKRYNKRTGRELKQEDIVKGVRQANGEYVVVSDEEVRAAFPKSTQTIEIDSFIKASEVPAMMLERPYYVQPIGNADKVYVLLRESMRDAQVVAVARLVMHTKEHLAMLIVCGSALVLNTLRWASDLRSPTQLKLPADAGRAAALTPAERKMASQLIREMTTKWRPQAYAEHFSAAIKSLVKRKVAAGQAKQVAPLEKLATEAKPSNVVDLRELLARSLRGRRGGTPEQGSAPTFRSVRRRSHVMRSAQRPRSRRVR
jgi:DNA end-binding protein Ku